MASKNKGDDTNDTGLDTSTEVSNKDSGSAPNCSVEGAVDAPVPSDGLRGKLTRNAPLAKLVWFKSGGAADWLFEPADLDFNNKNKMFM